MFETTIPQFFAALHSVTETHLGPEHSCTKAARDTANNADQMQTDLVQQELNKLAPDTREKILHETHQKLAFDFSAILSNWQVNPDKPN